MNTQSSIEKGAPGTLYTEYGVIGGGLHLYLNYSPNFIGQGLLPQAVQGEGTKGETTMFWAVFKYRKRTELVTMKGDPASVRGGVTVHRYIEVLEEHLSTILENDTLYIQHNSRVYTAIIVQDWFVERDIDVLDWPPYSPDMNPIENLQKILKAKIIELYPELVTMKDNNTTKELLIRAAKEAWLLLEEDLLNKLTLGIQKRIDVLKAAGGWYTKYQGTRFEVIKLGV